MSIITAFSKHLVTIPDISNHQVLSREEVILGLGESQCLSLNCSSNCTVQFEFNKLSLIYSSKIYSLSTTLKKKHLGGHCNKAQNTWSWLHSIRLFLFSLFSLSLCTSPIYSQHSSQHAEVFIKEPCKLCHSNLRKRVCALPSIPCKFAGGLESLINLEDKHRPTDLRSWETTCIIFSPPFLSFFLLGNARNSINVFQYTCFLWS